MKSTFRILAVSLACGSGVSAQRLYIGNADVEWSEVTLSGTNLVKKSKKPDGTETTQSIPASVILVTPSRIATSKLVGVTFNSN